MSVLSSVARCALLACPGDPTGCTTGEVLTGLFVAGWYVGANFRTGGPKAALFSAFVQAN